jgi:hypothetical protein
VYITPRRKSVHISMLLDLLTLAQIPRDDTLRCDSISCDGVPAASRVGFDSARAESQPARRCQCQSRGTRWNRIVPKQRGICWIASGWHQGWCEEPSWQGKARGGSDADPVVTKLCVSVWTRGVTRAVFVCQLRNACNRCESTPSLLSQVAAGPARLSDRTGYGKGLVRESERDRCVRQGEVATRMKESGA